MRIDVSNESFDLVQGYTRVLLQQGRPILDRDWNEQTAIVLHQLRAITRSIYGRHGGPAGGECGFIPRSGKELSFKGGWYTLDGLILNCPSGWKYPSAPEAGKQCLVYLEAIEREVTATEHESLLDSALPGIDMAARGQLMWRVNHIDWSDRINDSTSCRDASEKVNLWLAEKRKEQESPGILFPEDAAPEAVKKVEEKNKHKHGHKLRLKELTRKNPNHLFRVECHSVVSGSDKDEPTSFWKVSTDNAFALFEILKSSGQSQAPLDAVTIRTGVIGDWIPVKEQVVELLTKENLSFNEPGQLVIVKNVHQPDQSDPNAIDRRTIELSESVKNIGEFAFMRAWDSKFEMDPPQGAKPGDYWQFVGRSGTSTIDEAKLKRTTRAFAPLAMIRSDQNGIEVISRFQRIVGVPWREIDENMDAPN